MAAFQPVPFNSVYAATKSFRPHFRGGNRGKLREFGVRARALCPGSTFTEFQQVAGQPDRCFRVAETAEKVARVGLEGLAKGKTVVISGTSNTLIAEAQRAALAVSFQIWLPDDGDK